MAIETGRNGAGGLLVAAGQQEVLSWRWCMYVNLLFAGMAFTGGALLLVRQPSPVRPRLDIPGVLLVSGGVFCLVYGFSNAAAHSWHTPSTYGFLAVGVALGLVFAAWQGRAAHRPGQGIHHTQAGDPGTARPLKQARKGEVNQQAISVDSSIIIEPAAKVSTAERDHQFEQQRR